MLKHFFVPKKSHRISWTKKRHAFLWFLCRAESEVTKKLRTAGFPPAFASVRLRLTSVKPGKTLGRRLHSILRQHYSSRRSRKEISTGISCARNGIHFFAPHFSQVFYREPKVNDKKADCGRQDSNLRRH